MPIDARTRVVEQRNSEAEGFHIPTRSPDHFIYTHQLNEYVPQGRSHAPKLPSALLGAPTATTVSTPPVHSTHNHTQV